MPIDRQAVYAKCDGRCGYCGREIEMRQMQVDHICSQFLQHQHDGDIHGIDNLMPSCARCNKWKSAERLEFFRSEIQTQVSRLQLRSANFRMALDFGQITVNESPIVFHFERGDDDGK